MGGQSVVYYPDTRGRAPALEFILELDQGEQEKALAYISFLEEQGEKLRRPIADYLGDQIYELRPKQIRILYAFVGKEVAVILHAFRKKREGAAEGQNVGRNQIEGFYAALQAGIDCH